MWENLTNHYSDADAVMALQATLLLMIPDSEGIHKPLSTKNNYISSLNNVKKIAANVIISFVNTESDHHTKMMKAKVFSFTALDILRKTISNQSKKKSCLNWNIIHLFENKDSQLNLSSILTNLEPALDPIECGRPDAIVAGLLDITDAALISNGLALPFSWFWFWFWWPYMCKKAW